MRGSGWGLCVVGGRLFIGCPSSPPTIISPNEQITESAEETATYVTELTRSLAETPYRDANAEFNIMFNK